jgi:hypothetical protein
MAEVSKHQHVLKNGTQPILAGLFRRTSERSRLNGAAGTFTAISEAAHGHWLMRRRPHIHNVHKERRKEAKEERKDGCS